MAVRDSTPSSPVANQKAAAAEAPPLDQTTVNLTVVMPRFVPTFPGQLMLAARNDNDSDDDDDDDLSSLSSSVEDCPYGDDETRSKGRGYSYLTNSSYCARQTHPAVCQIRDDGRQKGGSRKRRSHAHNIRFFTWKRDTDSSKHTRGRSRGNSGQNDNAAFRLNPRELFAFSDLDYVIPQEVREVLKEEGVDESTLEAWLKSREVWHRRAEALRFFEMAK